MNGRGTATLVDGRAGVERRRGGVRLLDGLARAALVGAGAGLVGMSLAQFWQVFARYVLNSSPGWTEPVSALCMGFTVMLGAALGVRQEAHFGFVNLRDAMPVRPRRLAKVASRFVALATGLLLAWYGYLLVAGDWTIAMPGAPLPAGLRYASVVAGGLLIALFAIERLVRGDPSLSDRED